ncbi:amphoterin-induced protein 2-like [Arapaima gigas]
MPSPSRRNRVQTGSPLQLSPICLSLSVEQQLRKSQSSPPRRGCFGSRRARSLLRAPLRSISRRPAGERGSTQLTVTELQLASCDSRCTMVWAQPRGRSASWGAHGGGRCLFPPLAVRLLCCVCLVCCVSQGCPRPCLCAGDIVVCSSQNLSTIPASGLVFASRLDLSYNQIADLTPDWTLDRLEKLDALILHHNVISYVSPKALGRVPHVRYLDLSTNRVRTVTSSTFSEVKDLEVLLLFNNQISMISPQAFTGLHSLQRIYLSWNMLSEFPSTLLVGKRKLPQLGFLDLSYNLLTQVPVREIMSLPAWQQAGIYLHGNLLACGCALHTMLHLWFQKQFRSVTDFQSDYTCLLPGASRSLSVFSMSLGSMNCSGSALEASLISSHRVLEVHVGEALVLHCDSAPPRDVHTALLWVTPAQRVLRPTIHTGALHVFPNGSLELAKAHPEDSGVYTCIMLSPGNNLSQSFEVSVRVGNFSSDRSSQSFSTALTTLGSCGVSLVLVLLYLYLTPCRCLCRTKNVAKPHGGRSSMPGDVSCGWKSDCRWNDDAYHQGEDEPHCNGKDDALCGWKDGSGKKVVFLEPDSEHVQSSHVPGGGPLSRTPGSILKNSSAQASSIATLDSLAA